MQIIKVVHDKSEIEIEEKKGFVRFFFEQQLSESDLADIDKSITHMRYLVEKDGYISEFVDKHPDLFNIEYYAPRYIKSPRKFIDSLPKTMSDAFDEYSRLKSIKILTINEANRKYPNSKNTSVGTYTLHPRDSKGIVPIESFHSTVALEKDDECVLLLGQMGAKSINIIESNEQRASGAIKASVGVGYSDVDIDSSHTKVLRNTKELCALFEGTPIKTDANLLNNSKWYKDHSNMKMIFESVMRKNNTLKAFRVENTYTESFDFDFNLASKYLSVNIDILANYQKLSNIKRIFEVTFP